jgi:hypothetical protein
MKVFGSRQRVVVAAGIFISAFFYRITGISQRDLSTPEMLFGSAEQIQNDGIVCKPKGFYL